MKIILASASPRRRELLSQIGLEFTVVTSNVKEEKNTDIPELLVKDLSMQKAEAVSSLLREEKESFLVIGADTVVACDGQIMGKPADEFDAERMLRMLSGRFHEVHTGVSVLVFDGYGQKRESLSFCESTRVKFYKMSEEEIREYVRTGDCMDKAGAYGIQGFCARYIERIEGDYNNVVGLPAGLLYQKIKKYL